MITRTPPGPTGIRLRWKHGQVIHADYLVKFIGMQDGVNTFVIVVSQEWFDDWRRGEMEVHIGVLPGLTQVALTPTGEIT